MRLFSLGFKPGVSASSAIPAVGTPKPKLDRFLLDNLSEALFGFVLHLVHFVPFMGVIMA